jgi:molybdopterin-guanine dinucleotide biosynthesis protein A
MSTSNRKILETGKIDTPDTCRHFITETLKIYKKKYTDITEKVYPGTLHMLVFFYRKWLHFDITQDL